MTGRGNKHEDLRAPFPLEGSDEGLSDAITILSSGDAEAMAALAVDHGSAPEVLFVLSQSPSSVVRAKVAANPSTPEFADELLVDDDIAEVRSELGRKLTRLLPELTDGAAVRLRDAACAKLLVLARDTEAIVRRTLAAEIAPLDCAPREVILSLVRDLDELVAAPIAEFSPLLDDDDLIALIGEMPSTGTLAAIARRQQLSSDISDRLVETGDPMVIGALLRNISAIIREATLERLIDQAAAVDAWHEPLVDRPELTARLVAKLSDFVADSLVKRLAARPDLSAELRTQLESRVGASASRPAAAAGAPSEDAIRQAIERRGAGAVLAAIAARASISPHSVKRVFATRMPKSIIALAWKAGLTMETAIRLQEFPGRVPPARRIMAASDGSYPLTVDELDWHIATLGLAPVRPTSPLENRKKANG